MSVQTDLEARVASLRGVLDNSNAALTNKGGGAVESLSGIPAAIQSLPSGGENLDEELANQDKLIEQIIAAIEGKIGSGEPGGGSVFAISGVYVDEAYAGVYTSTGSVVIQ